MKKAPTPTNESDRLKALRRYEVLDSASEKSFDELTKLAATICGTKIALVSLVDEHRQWFKSHYGIGVGETPRDISFCGHAIMGDDLLIVEDATGDERFTQNPLVLGEPHIRFYAGAPLITPEGHHIGTLCVIDDEAKSLDPLQRDFLKTLAQQVITLLELKLKNDELLSQNRLFESYARGIDKYAIVAKTNVEGKITYVNELFCQITGYSERELIGRDHRMINSGHHNREFFQDLWGTIKSGKVWRGEIKNRTKEGREYWVDTTITPGFNADGSICEFIAFRYDITERKLSEIELKESQQKVRSSYEFLDIALETANLGIWDWDLRTNAAHFDDRWIGMLGYERSEIAAHISAWETLVHPDDLPRCYHEIMAYLDGKASSYEVMFRMKHKDGDYVHIFSRGRFSEFDEAGKPVRFTGVHFDISQQKKLEAQLIEAQEIAKVGSWTFNLKTRVQSWSSEHYKIFEIEEPQSGEFLYKLYRERIHPDDIGRLDYLTDRAITQGEGFVFDHRVVLDGGTRIKHVQGIGKVTKDKHGVPVFLSGTCRDRTSDVESEERYRMLLESMSEGLVVQNTKGEIVQYNSSALKILGTTPSQLLGKTLLDSDWKAVREDGSDLPSEEHPTMVALRTAKVVRDVVMGIRQHGHDMRWIRISAVPIDTALGRRVLCTFSDITELMAANETNKLVLDALGIGIWRHDLVTDFHTWDRSVFELFEVSPGQFSGTGREFETFLTNESKELFAKMRDSVAAGQGEIQMNFGIVSAKGQQKFLASRGKVVRDEDGKPRFVYGVVWDKSKEHELEVSLEHERAKGMHNAKLASIGQLAAGVGHEINNPLAIIAGQISMAEQLLEERQIVDPKIKERFVKMETAITRIANIVKGLRTFARSDDNQILSFNAHDLLVETFEMLRDIYLREEVKITLSSETTDAVIYGNRGRLQQVLFNLISNAKDATTGFSTREIQIKTTAAAGNFKISVSDNGCGISADLREKIFEPFFTTKEVNKGTGIGLSLVSTIIKEHDGRIEVISEPGKGATFIIELPLKAGASKDTSEPAAQRQLQNFKADIRLLVVDDEADLREVLQFKLGLLCREVVTAASATEALERLKHESFDLVFSDIKMPDIDGFTFLEMVRENRKLNQPDFVFITGGVEMSREQESFLKYKSKGVIMKPFRDELLRKKLSELFPEKFATLER